MNTLIQYTHAELVQIAYKWVLNNAGCGVAFRELKSNSSKETPDVIGFGHWGHSVVVECKISLSDFHADKRKEFRAKPEQGMGSHRFYCCPKGLIKVDQLPEKWGLIYVDEKGKAKLAHSPYGGNCNRYTIVHAKDMRAEHGLLYSALRRLHLRGRIEEIYTQDE